MRSWKKPCVYVMLASMAGQLAPQPQALADHFFGRVARLVQEKEYSGVEPETCADDSIEVLAENIDWLEHHIDTYGSVVAKQPDVWGEARLTSHREEYEQEMFKTLNQFQVRINAIIQQSDSSFLSQSIALANAAAGAPSGTPDTVAAGALAASTSNVSGQGSIQLEPTLELDQLSRYLQHLQELRRINEGDDTSDSPGYALNLVRVPVSILPGKLTREGFGAEITISAQPVLSEDLLPTTFRNLVTNDLVDQLGLPIVRLAELDEASLEATKKLRNLRDTRRTLQEIAKRFTEIHQRLDTTGISDADIAYLLRPYHDKQELETILERTFATTCQPAELQMFAKRRLLDAHHPHELDYQSYAEGAIGDLLRCASQHGEPMAEIDQQLAANYVELHAKENDGIQASNHVTLPISPGRSRVTRSILPPTQISSVFGSRELMLIATEFRDTYAKHQVRWNGSNDAKDTLADVSLLDVHKWLQAESVGASEFLDEPDHLLIWNHLAKPDGRLAEAIRSDHMNVRQFGPASVENLRDWFFYAIHNEHDDNGAALERFLANAHTSLAPQRDQAATAVEALAWAVVCESALLNKRLNEDVRKVAVATQKSELRTDRDYSFFLPDTVSAPAPVVSELESPELAHADAHGHTSHALYAMMLPSLQAEHQQASQLFMQYVSARWPIHVFALDPREQDQDVADASARRRELQFALSLAFVTGEIGARTLTQYSRTLQTNVETISLNRTAAGFAHGADTFGWRFYPRVQALDVPGTAGALYQTFRGTPRDHDVRKRQLEPGMRECVAIVLMPSFVPYADFHVRSNWFRLTNPKNAALTMKDTVRLSRAITAMRNSQAQCAKCAHCYREGEVDRLLNRVTQLDRELPLQSMRAQIPYENTLGGFEMFNAGITDLCPEMIGWYGAPGVVIGDNYFCGCFQGCTLNKEGASTPAGAATPSAAEVSAKAAPLPECEGPGTTLFLVGDNFSIHDTRVVAGGVCIPHMSLISRQIMQITIPSCVQTVEIDKKKYVSVYAATPYGVTNHLHIPIVEAPKSAEQKAQEEQIKGLTESLNVLTEAAPTLKTEGTLSFDADCAALGSSRITLISKNPPMMDVELGRAAQPPGIQGYQAAISYKGILSGAFDVQISRCSIEDATLHRLHLDKFTIDRIIEELATAQPSITTTSFDDKGKAEARLYLYAVTADGRTVPLAGQIPIEVTLACKCCETAKPAVAPATPACPPAKPLGTAPSVPTPAPEPVTPSEGSKGAGEALPSPTVLVVPTAPATAPTEKSADCNCQLENPQEQ